MNRRSFLVSGGTTATVLVSGCMGYELTETSHIDDLEDQLSDRNAQLIEQEQELAEKQNKIDELEEQLDEGGGIGALPTAYQSVLDAIENGDDEFERATTAVSEEVYREGMLASASAYGFYQSAYRMSTRVAAVCDAYDLTEAEEIATETSRYAEKMTDSTFALAQAADAALVGETRQAESYRDESEAARSAATEFEVATVDSFQSAVK